MFDRRTWMGAAGAIAAVTWAGIVGAQAPAQAPVKVGFVYVSPIGDAGWTFQHGNMVIFTTSFGYMNPTE
jgi:simple sugar transport system substrate-binding protein